MYDFQEMEELVQPACQRFGVQELSLFGSQARGGAGPGSDYDFAVLFDTTHPGLLSDRFFGLLFFLEEHLGAPVDLLELDAVRNPYLRDSIEEEKRLLYGTRNTEIAF